LISGSAARDLAVCASSICSCSSARPHRAVFRLPGRCGFPRRGALGQPKLAAPTRRRSQRPPARADNRAHADGRYLAVDHHPGKSRGGLHYLWHDSRLCTTNIRPEPAPDSLACREECTSDPTRMGGSSADLAASVESPGLPAGLPAAALARAPDAAVARATFACNKQPRVTHSYPLPANFAPSELQWSPAGRPSSWSATAHFTNSISPGLQLLSKNGGSGL
jgi:hypothetical protein